MKKEELEKEYNQLLAERNRLKHQLRAITLSNSLTAIHTIAKTVLQETKAAAPVSDETGKVATHEFKDTDGYKLTIDLYADSSALLKILSPYGEARAFEFEAGGFDGFINTVIK